MAASKMLLLSGLGVIAGGLIAEQSVLNSSMGQRTGQFGAVLVLTIISIAVLIVLILLFPASADFRHLAGLTEWPLYLGGALGVAILAAPIFLVPRIGTTATMLSMVLGQSLFALLIDHFGLLASPKIEINLARVAGVMLVAAGAYLVGR